MLIILYCYFCIGIVVLILPLQHKMDLFVNMCGKTQVDQMELEPITCRGKVGYTALIKSPAHCRCKDAKTSQI